MTYKRDKRAEFERKKLADAAAVEDARRAYERCQSLCVKAQKAWPLGQAEAPTDVVAAVKAFHAADRAILARGPARGGLVKFQPNDGATLRAVLGPLEAALTAAGVTCA